MRGGPAEECGRFPHARLSNSVHLFPAELFTFSPRKTSKRKIRHLSKWKAIMALVEGSCASPVSSVAEPLCRRAHGMLRAAAKYNTETACKRLWLWDSHSRPDWGKSAISPPTAWAQGVQHLQLQKTVSHFFFLCFFLFCFHTGRGKDPSYPPSLLGSQWRPGSVSCGSTAGFGPTTQMELELSFLGWADLSYFKEAMGLL